jgi:hypothetical protein
MRYLSDVKGKEGGEIDGLRKEAKAKKAGGI